MAPKRGEENILWAIRSEGICLTLRSLVVLDNRNETELSVTSSLLKMSYFQKLPGKQQTRHTDDKFHFEKYTENQTAPQESTAQ